MDMLANTTASTLYYFFIFQWNQNCLTPWTTLALGEANSYSASQEIVQSVGTEIVNSVYFHQKT
jgi:hypothetical protein